MPVILLYGCGRFYAGSITTGTIQLVAGLTGWILFFAAGAAGYATTDGGMTLGIVCLVLAIVILIPLTIWVVVDGVMMFAGRGLIGRTLR